MGEQVKALLRDHADGNFLGMPYQVMHQPIVSSAEPSKTLASELTVKPCHGGNAATLIEYAKARSSLVELDLSIIESISRLSYHQLPPNKPIWVNLFPCTLTSSTAVAEICEHALNSKVPVCFEITEGEVLSDYGVITDNLNALRSTGAGIVLDDFGAGASSIRMLLEIPFDAVKVDWKVFQLCAENPVHHPMLLGIIKSISQVGSIMIAEGVETPAHLSVAQNLGVEFVQGFHIALPEKVSASPFKLAADF